MPYETVTVEEAIKKGRRQLYYQTLLVGIVVFAVWLYAIGLIHDGSMWMPIVGFSGLMLFVTIPSIYYLKMLPIWRIWAFTCVRNVHELKRTAQLAQIMPVDGSFLWRMEIKNATQKARLAELHTKFEQPDIFIDDPSLQFETTYTYSRIENIFYLLFFSAGLIILMAFIFHKNWLFSIVLAGACIPIGLMTYKRFRDSGPLIIISNEGITTIENGFCAWSDIQDESILWNASYYAFVYKANGKLIKIKLSEITGLSSYKIDPILRTYRGRYEAKRTKTV